MRSLPFELTPLAQKTVEWVSENDANDYEDAPEDVRDFLENESCSDGFEYGLWDGGYIHPEKWIKNYNPDKFTVNQLEQFKYLWEENSIEF